MPNFADSLCEGNSRQASPAASGLVQTVEGKRSSRLATMTRGKDSTDGVHSGLQCALMIVVGAGFLAPVVTGTATARGAVLESPGSSELNEEEESPEPDADYMEEYDSEEDRKQKKKRRPPPKVRSSVGNNVNNSSITRSSKAAENDKPFPCSCK